MKIHSKLAGGIYAIIYIITCFFIEEKFKLNFCKNILFFIILLVSDIFVYKFFADRYDGDSSV